MNITRVSALGGVILAILLLVAWYATQPTPASIQSTISNQAAVSITPVGTSASAAVSAPATVSQTVNTAALLPNTSDSTASKAKYQLKRQLDLTTYPGSLFDNISRALDHQDGELAADMANLLSYCETIADALSANPKIKITGESSLISALLLSARRDYAQCQTVPGDQQLMRKHLLKLAYDKKVPGAALELLTADYAEPQLAASVINDALAGDFSSLRTIAVNNRNDLPVDADTLATLRYAFELAAHDPEIGDLIRPELLSAEKLAHLLGKINTEKFDHRGLSDASKQQASLIAARILARAKLLAK